MEQHLPHHLSLLQERSLHPYRLVVLTLLPLLRLLHPLLLLDSLLQLLSALRPLLALLLPQPLPPYPLAHLPLLLELVPLPPSRALLLEPALLNLPTTPHASKSLL